MVILQEIPIIKNKLFSFVGARDFEMDTGNELQDLILTLKGFIYSLKAQLPFITKLKKSEIEDYYNIIYQAIGVFTKINDKLKQYNYFSNSELKMYFDKIIKILKQHRKDLLILIEGELLEISKLSTSSKAFRKLQKND